MGSTFNPQILVDKLVKLNNSQASIETLSHWCIFHMNKAKYVVETWDRQFHCSPREQRLAFLYLANDILQNSRRKGSEFVAEFWKVLPDALRDVIHNGDEFGKNAALRLVGILEERKVFGSRGQTLKEELLGKHLENSNRNEKQIGAKLKQPIGSMMDKIVSGYQVVYGGPMDEDSILNKCRNAANFIEKIDKEMEGQINSEQLHGTALEELQEQHSTLKDSIKQLMAIESSRSSLVSYLREALRDEEIKLEQIHHQLQAAQNQSEHASNICQRLPRLNNAKMGVERSSKESSTPITSQGYIPGEREQSAPVMYEKQASISDRTNCIEDSRKSAAAAVAAKLTASTSSAEMLSYVLSSLASEGVIGNQIKEPPANYPSEKRARLETDQPYVPSHNPSQPQHPFQQSGATTSQQLTPNDPPPLPSSPPPMAPLPPMPAYSLAQYMPSSTGINGVPYNYNMSLQQPTNSMPGYPAVGTQMTGVAPFTMAQANSYQSYQGSDGSLYSQQSSMPMAPMSRQ